MKRIEKFAAEINADVVVINRNTIDVVEKETRHIIATFERLKQPLRWSHIGTVHRWRVTILKTGDAVYLIDMRRQGSLDYIKELITK